MSTSTGNLQRTLSGAMARWSRVVDFWLPRQCLLCGQPAEASNLCLPCQAELPRLRESCPACAMPMPHGSPGHCGACLRRLPPWSAAVAALDYRPPADWLVQRFKFNRDFACGHALAEVLLEALRRRGRPWPDAVVPVPLHRRRQLRRTYNQAELLARHAARGLSLTFICPLQRARHTAAQAGLDKAARRRNTRGAFTLRGIEPGLLRGAQLALVDDVLTTGATLAECTRLLRRAGAASVEVWVAARATAH